ncbi:copia protein, partial [Tanacetum coccineum]
SLEDAVADDAGKKTNEEPVNEGERNGQEKEEGASNKKDVQNVDSTVSPSVSTAGGAYDNEDKGAEAALNNLETTMNVSHIPTIRIHKDHPKDQIIGDINLATQTRRMTKISKEHAMRLVDLPKGKHAIGIKWVYRNKKDERGIVVKNKARLVAQGYTQEEGIDYDEVYMCQPPGFEDPQFPDKVYKVEKALYGLHQAPRAWYETLSTYLLENRFRRGTIDKTLFIKKDKGDILLVQVFQVTPKVSHLHAVKRIFRYLKGQPKLGLWYPRDSPFDLEAFSDSDYARASLDRKSTIGGCQFLGKRLISWQCKNQTIVANSTTEAEYVVAANCCGQVLWIQNQMLDYGFNFMNTKIYIDNESTICIVKNPMFHSKTKHIEMRHHFIKDSYEKRLIQVIKIHTDQNVADLIIKAFDVGIFQYLTANGTTANDEIQVSTIGLPYYWCSLDQSRLNLMLLVQVNAVEALIDKKKVIITETSIRSDLKLDDAEGTDCLPTATIFVELEIMGAKTISWNEFSSTMASAIICLATNQKFNFSKYIFDNMVKNLEGGVKFLMYPRLVQVFMDKQVEGMPRHKGIYVIPSHTKKVFANMKKPGKDSTAPTDSHSTPIHNQPSLSKPQKKKSRRKQRKDSGLTEPISDEATNEEHVATPSCDPPQSALEIESWKRREKSLEKRRKSRTPGFKRLRKLGSASKVESSNNVSLGAQEDASKQGRKIADLDADAKVTLVDETQEINDDNLMFDTGVLEEQEIEFEKVVEEPVASVATTTKSIPVSATDPVTTAAEVVTIASAPTTTIDELTLAQTLIEIKVAKPKAVTSAATTTTITRPKARGVVVQEPSKFKKTSSSSQASQLPQAKDKGKAKIVEPEKPLKKKDQIAMDEEVARNLKAQLQAELEEEERISRLKEEEANIALLESWDNTQAMMDVDFQLAQQMQTEEQEQLSIEEKSKLFVELLEKRKKHFAALRAQEKRSKPPTKAQKRNTMSTYLKNMAGYKHNQLKSKSYDEIQEMFNKEMKKGDELESDKLKKQKMDEYVEAEKYNQEEVEMKRHIKIVKDDEVAIDAIPLATKPPVIDEYKIDKNGRMGYFKLIRANGSSKRYSSMIKMLQDIDREDLETLWKLVKAKHENTRPKEDYERVLWGDLKVMFEPDIKSKVWRNLQGYKVTVWKLFDNRGVRIKQKPQENDSKPEPEPAKKKTSSKRRVKKKVTLSVDDNIITYDPDAALEIVTESVSESAKKKSSGRNSKSVVIQDTPNIVQALKESRKTSRRKPGTRGSNKGTGSKLGVLDESTDIFATSSEGTSAKPGVLDEENDITEEKVILEWGDEQDSEFSDDDNDDVKKDDKDGDANDEGDDHVSDTQDADDEDDETESDEDEIYKYKIRVRKDEDVEMKDAEVEESDKGEEKVTDAAKEEAEKTSEAKDDTKKTELPPSSSSLSVPSGFGDQFLKLSSDSSLVSTVKDSADTNQTPTPILTQPIITDAPTIMTAIPESDALSVVELRVAKLEKDVSKLKTVDHSSEALVVLQSQVPIVVDSYLDTKVGDIFQKELQKHMTYLIHKYSLQHLPELTKKPTPTTKQESKKSPLEILKIKKEQVESQKNPQFTIKSTDKAALEEYDLKSALYQSMHANKSFNRIPANHRLYHALMEALIEDENEMDKGVTDIVKDHKRKHDDDEDPPTGPNQGKKTKRRRTKESKSSKNPSSTKDTPKGKAPTKGSKTSKSASEKEPIEEPIAEVVMDDVGDDNQPQDTSEPKTRKTLNPDWIKQPPRPPTPDLEWNKHQDPLSFNDLMATLIDFSKYVLNGLKIENLTQYILLGHAFNLLKGTCSSIIELEYNFQEYFNDLTDKLDWNNREGDCYPFDLSKPLPLQGPPGHQTITADYFFNNDLKYLKTFDPEVTYTISSIKTKATRYEIKGIEEMVPTLWSTIKHAYDKDAEKGIKPWGKRRKLWYRSQVSKFSKQNIYSTKVILGVKSVSVKKLHGYGHLEEIVVKRSDQQLYKFKEGDFVDLHLNENVPLKTCFYVVQAQAIPTLTGVLMLTLCVYSYQKKLNITKPQKTFPEIEFKEPYTPSYDPPGIVYEDLDKQKRVLRANELYKFSDGTLKSVHDEIHHRVLEFRLDYNKEMPKRKWMAVD